MAKESKESNAAKTRTMLKEAIVLTVKQKLRDTKTSEQLNDVKTGFFKTLANSISYLLNVKHNITEYIPLIGNSDNSNTPNCSQISEEDKARLKKIIDSVEYHSVKNKQIASRIRKARKDKALHSVPKTAKVADAMDEVYAQIEAFKKNASVAEQSLINLVLPNKDKGANLGYSEKEKDEIPISGIHDLPIHSAAGHGKLETLKKIVERNPKDLSISNREGNTALHIALAFKQPEICEYILELVKDMPLKYSKPIIINYNYNGHTPLHIAVMANFRVAIENLFDIIIRSIDLDKFDNLSDVVLIEDIRGNNVIDLARSDADILKLVLLFIEQIKAKFVYLVDESKGEDKKFFELELKRWNSILEDEKDIDNR